MSMDARGQLNKTLVFMGWKGIKDVRQYVIPANPRSAGQVVQRGYMTAAVANWKSAIKNVLDVAACNLLASIEAKPMSGFNSVVKNFIRITKLAITPILWTNGIVTVNTAGAVTITIDKVGAQAAEYVWGSSPLNMANTGMGSYTDPTLTCAMTGLVPGADVFFKVHQVTAGAENYSGIYKVRVLP
jgi:hypothetical protein